LHAFVAAPDHEGALLAELGGVDGPRWPCVLSVRRAVEICDPVFALQQLPAARLVRAAALPALAEAAAAAIADGLAALPGPYRLHVFVPDPARYRSLLPLVRAAEDALLRALRARGASAPVRAGAPDPGLPLVQVAVVGRTVWLISVAAPRPLPTGGFDLAPWPAGKAPVREDREAPSRAYRKLVEGFSWLGDRPGPGQTVVDLGGAPGGWAWTALRGGARVTAVDRSPLAPPALGHPALEMVVGNAFTYAPAAPVDWLLCDVICEPQRSIELADRWMEAGLCRRLCVTIKFKGDGSYALLPAARARLGRHGWPFLRLKHLQHHHNEAVVLAAR
jgi:23S rRNA (cytidine2498-2'-O)-methyltransferase